MRTKIKLSTISSWSVLVKSALICALLGVVIFGISLKRVEPLPLNTDPLHFNSRNAHQKMTDLSKKFPNRVTWGPTRIEAAKWIKDELRGLGYTPEGMFFSEVIAGKQYSNLENVYAIKRGTKHPEEIILAVAHYDITDTTVEGAMDDASGVGVVLELARVFAKEETDRTVVFLLTDSEEFGAFWGARAFAQHFAQADKIVAALNFDFISAEKVTSILTLCDGLKTGYTPLWLREIALDSVRSIPNVKSIDLAGAEEFVIRAMQIPPADHGAFLASGIPSFNWVGQTDNFAYIMTHYHHTEHDVAEAMLPQSFEGYGLAAERVIRTLNALPKIPADFRNSSYWKVSSRYYLDGTATLLLHILAFIPFLVYALNKSKKTISMFRADRIRGVIASEAKMMVLLLGSLLLGYVMIRALPMLHVITQYETFPATQKSLLLYTPNFIAIFLVLASIAVVYFVFHKIFALTDDSNHREIRHTLHCASLAFIICLAFLKNSYLAVLLLLPPAYFWTAMRNKRTAESRILNTLLLLGGAITFVAISIVLSTIFHIGVFYWYIFLSAAYGLISAYTVVLFFMALTVMIRIFKSFVL